MQRRVRLLLLFCCRNCRCSNCHAAACRCHTATVNATATAKMQALWHKQPEKEAKGVEHQEGVDPGQGQKKVSVVKSRWSGEKGGERDEQRWNVCASTCPWRWHALYLSSALS